MRAWTAIATERTRRQREQLAEEISRIADEKLRIHLRHTMSRLMMFIEDDLEQWLARPKFSRKLRARGAGKAEAALAEIVQLIAENKFEPNYLIGMINGIAKHGPRQDG
jgi:hypothetical protein